VDQAGFRNFPRVRKSIDLAQPFRDKVAKFIAAIKAAGATLVIADTLRPPERAYLMHFSFAIAREGVDPGSVPARTGVDIQWVHPDTPGTPSAVASKNAAEKMVQGYGIAFKPALNSRHTEGNAVDMSISWIGDLVVAKGDGTKVTITSAPRDGNNASLHQVGSSYGVIKLVTDPPHWSTDGH
jgi:D-alanyl-D-alanine dipeptidase